MFKLRESRPQKLWNNSARGDLTNVIMTSLYVLKREKTAVSRWDFILRWAKFISILDNGNQHTDVTPGHLSQWLVSLWGIYGELSLVWLPLIPSYIPTCFLCTLYFKSCEQNNPDLALVESLNKHSKKLPPLEILAPKAPELLLICPLPDATCGKIDPSPRSRQCFSNKKLCFYYYFLNSVFSSLRFSH